MKKALIIISAVFLASVTLVFAAPNETFFRNVFPEMDSLYKLGSSTNAWLQGTFDELCLTADTCRTTWPTGGGGSGSGTISTSTPVGAGAINLLTYWTGLSTIGATSSPTVGYITGTSTTATSSLPNLNISQQLKQGEVILIRYDGVQYSFQATSTTAQARGVALMNAFASANLASTTAYATSTIRVGPGIFNIGNNILDMPKYLSVIGSGKFTTQIVSTALLSTGTTFSANSYTVVSNLAIAGDACWGYGNASRAMTKAFIYNIFCEGASDGIYFNTIQNVDFIADGFDSRNHWDNVSLSANSGIVINATFRNSRLESIGPATSGQLRGITMAAASSTLNVFDTEFISNDNGDLSASDISGVNLISGTVNLYSGYATTTQTAGNEGTVYDLNNVFSSANAHLKVSPDFIYNPLKENGTIEYLVAPRGGFYNASTTNFFGANLSNCNSASNALTWTTTGKFGCNTISASGIVNSGTYGQFAWYGADGTTVSATGTQLTVGNINATSTLATSTTPNLDIAQRMKLGEVIVTQSDGTIYMFRATTTSDINRGNALYNAVQFAASTTASTTVTIGPGSYHIGGRKLPNFPNNFRIEGQGRGITTVISTIDNSANLFNVNLNAYIGGMNIFMPRHDVNNNIFGPQSSLVGTSTITVFDVETFADSDTFFWGSVASNGTTINVFNSKLNCGYDCWASNNNSSVKGVVNFYNTQFFSGDPYWAGVTGGSRGINGGGGFWDINVFNSQFKIGTGTLNMSTALYTNGASTTINCYNSSIETNALVGKDMQNDYGVINNFGCTYDRSKTQGYIDNKDGNYSRVYASEGQTLGPVTGLAVTDFAGGSSYTAGQVLIYAAYAATKIGTTTAFSSASTSVAYTIGTTGDAPIFSWNDPIGATSGALICRSINGGAYNFYRNLSTSESVNPDDGTTGWVSGTCPNSPIARLDYSFLNNISAGIRWGLDTNNQIRVASTTGTSTFSGGLQADVLRVATTTASSTFANGINLTKGCFSVNGTCVGSGSGSVTGVTGTWPIISSGGTAPNITWGGLSTSTAITVGGMPYWTGQNTFGNVATGTASCTTGVSCTSFTVIGSSPSITSTLGTSVDLTSEVTGILPIANGGTNASTLTLGNIWFDGTRISATSSAFTVGSLISTTTATSTFTGGISAGIFNATSTTASSTFQNGIDLKGGCYAVLGTCLSAGGGSGTVSSGVYGQIGWYGASGTTISATGTQLTIGNINATTTATSTFGGPITIGSTTLPMLNSLLSMTGFQNNYIQANIRNRSAGNNASASYVATADNGTDSTYYAEFGINGSGFAQAGQSSQNAGDSFLLANDGALVIGTASSTNPLADIRFIAGGLASSSIAGVIDNANGNFGIATSSPYSKLSVAGQIVAQNYNATSTTATSTFSGDMVQGSSAQPIGFNVDYLGNAGFGMTAGTAKISASSTANQLRIYNANGTSFTTIDQNSTNSFSLTSAVDSATAFIFKSSGLASVLTIDTLNLNVGVGTTSPSYRLGVRGKSGDPRIPIFSVASSTDTDLFGVTGAGHVFASTTPPAVSSGSVDGTDLYGRVTGCSSTCTVTFTVAYPKTPSCVVAIETMSLVNAMSYVPSATNLAVTQTGLGTFDYICHGK